jgi:hypothetical protein
LIPRPLQHLRQLRDIEGDAARLVAGEKVRCGAPVGLILIIDVTQRLPIGVADGKARAVVFDVSRRREAAGVVDHYQHLSAVMLGVSAVSAAASSMPGP